MRARIAGGLALAVLGLGTPPALAQDAPAPAAATPSVSDTPAVTPTRKVAPKKRVRVVKPKKAAEAAKPTEATEVTKPIAAAASAPAKPVDSAKPADAGKPNPFDEQFLKAGATTCASRVSELAAASMQGVTSVGTASNWYKAAPDQRPVSLLLGQKFGPKGVPYGATGVFAAPRADGSCDALSIQVVPSALPCAKLRESLAARGKQVADLAGVPLMQDAAGQTMLVPTAAGTCVLVGLRAAYAR